MRLVLDTNVVVSAFVWRGKPRKLIEAALTGSVQLFTSPPLLAELEEVLKRHKFDRARAHARLSVDSILREYAHLAFRVEPDPIFQVAADPDDDKVLGTATAAQAGLVVSGDKHLLSLGQFAGIQIVRAADMVLRLEIAGESAG